MATQFKKISIGNSDFKKIIENDHYYVDKTLFIKELLDSGSEVTLITRPRRFGKTLNLSMLKYWFERYDGWISDKREAVSGKKEKRRTQSENSVPNTQHSMPNTCLFQHLKIWQQGEEYTKHCGKYPVIFITLKEAKETNWKNCFQKLQSTLSRLYEEHSYLLESDIFSKSEIEKYESILEQKANEIVCKESLFNLTNYLYQYYNQKVIVLIDEYDAPVHEAFEYGFYTDIIGFLRSFLGSCLKDNLYLEKAVVTGILRVTRESLFSDLNNPKIVTLIEDIYSDKFGFTEDEVIKFLQDYQLDHHIEGVKQWYNGYIIGDNQSIYNPWSIINFIDNPSGGFKPYWVNTSGNTLINHLLARANETTKSELEQLIAHQSITKKIDSHIVFSEIDTTSENLWSFLLFTGYLKIIRKIQEGKNIQYELMIPNLEVETIYDKFIEGWFTNSLGNDNVKFLLESILTGDAETFEDILQDFVLKYMSSFDIADEEPEKVYHAFVLGLLVHCQTHKVKSNRESGFGRYDIMMIPIDINQAGVVIEFKKVDPDDDETLETACNSALQQIVEKAYSTELQEMGVKQVYQYGIGFDGKKVMVKKVEHP